MLAQLLCVGAIWLNGQPGPEPNSPAVSGAPDTDLPMLSLEDFIPMLEGLAPEPEGQTPVPVLDANPTDQAIPVSLAQPITEMPCAAEPAPIACPAPIELPPVPVKAEPPAPPEPAPEPEPEHQDPIAEEADEEAEKEEPTPEAPAEEPSSAKNAERLAELEELFSEIMSDPEPAAFDGEEARPVTAIRFEGASMMVLSIRDHAAVASDYVRVMNIASFVEDPEKLEPFVRRIIVCPAPDLDEYLTVPRKTVAKRLEQAGVPLDHVVMTGAREILVMRTKAQGPDAVEPEENADDDEAAVRKNESVLIVREGSFFQIEERGTAQADGVVGETIDITDRKGREFRALITEKGTVKPVEEKQ